MPPDIQKMTMTLARGYIKLILASRFATTRIRKLKNDGWPMSTDHNFIIMIKNINSYTFLTIF
jgi:hypothetical protein